MGTGMIKFYFKELLITADYQLSTILFRNMIKMFLHLIRYICTYMRNLYYLYIYVCTSLVVLCNTYVATYT